MRRIHGEMELAESSSGGGGGSLNALLYPTMLVQCQLFEMAVKYLWETHPLESVHLGIGLRHYGLLRLVSDVLPMSYRTLYVVDLESYVCKWSQHIRDASAQMYFYYLYMMDEYAEAPYKDRKSTLKVCSYVGFTCLTFFIKRVIYASS